MKYIIGFTLAISLGINACFIYSLKRYQIEIREYKRHKDEKIAYYEYWSFTFPRMVNVLDSNLDQMRVTSLSIGEMRGDTTGPEQNYYVQFSHQ